MILSCTRDAKENRYVIVSDIREAFLYTDISNDNIHTLLEGAIAEIITKLDPMIYRKYLWYNKEGKPMLYQLKRFFFAIVQVALLFWNVRNNTGVGIQTQPK